jgi:hypothetical protein
VTRMPIDLDALLSWLDDAVSQIDSDADAIDNEWGIGSAYKLEEVRDKLKADVPALVAELRAAREVVEAAADLRHGLSYGGAVEKWARLDAKLAAYDRAVSHAD